ncbi:hypothetical protein AbraIFM66951_006573 [Aspergillus brasiliensis]|uniref:Rhodopsin domain-containing protein n=1 Tax=Aspergillus brasiliensis TaxID=319629 RepID=A0A9W5YM12_9EURO|nr:hypothetical protein AbraCBS73388_011484 [Aspergillus brasiliensis]GKZ44409.1 hypothetical protein AbraIFM66951_006573 [Aspergillus brasiliensis]
MYLWTISLVTQILCLTLVSGFVAMRGVVAWKLKKRVDVEDDVTNGGNNPPTLLNSSQTTIVYKLYYTLTILYVPMTLLAKLTLLAILARLFILRRGQILTVYLTITLTTLYYITILFIKIFICTPVSTFWTHPNDPQNPHCLSEGAVILADAVMSVVTDLAILLLPVGLMFPLKLAVVKKVKVGAMLGCGGLAVGFSIYRVVLVAGVGLGGLGNSRVYAELLLSGNAEGGFGLICSCIPALHILVSGVKSHMRRKGGSSIAKCGSSASRDDGKRGQGQGLEQGHGQRQERRQGTISSTSDGTAAPIVVSSSPDDILRDPGGLLASVDDDLTGDDVDRSGSGNGDGSEKGNNVDKDQDWV